uniref:acetate--CoA ligase family protein n=1 Tax=Roseovarius salis TaxID=3376063 RepID=UPI0037C55B3B
DAGARALLSRLGIAQVEALPDLLETLKLLHFAGPLPSNRIVSMSCSGGEASLMADSAVGRDVVFPPLSAAQTDRLRAALGPMVALANPLDYHTFIWTDVPRMAETFTAAMQGDTALGCLIADFPREDRCDPSAWECLYEAGARATKAAGKPLAVVATLPDAMSESVAERISAHGMIPMQGLDETLVAIEAAARIGQASGPAAPLILPGAPSGLRTLSEAQAKSALARDGVTVPASLRAGNETELAAAARDIGLPLVIKAEGLAHKTEAGGVAFARNDVETALEAARRMPCDTWLVEEMVGDAVAELLVGVVRDPAHGFVLTLGAGGTLTELIADGVSMLLPVDEAGILGALDRLRIAPMLAGYRGRPGADRAAIVRAILGVQAYVEAHAADLDEVEINPLLCTPDRAVAADALIRIGGDQ